MISAKTWASGMPPIKPTIVVRNIAELGELVHTIIGAEGFECNLNFIDVSQVDNMDSLFAHNEFNGCIDRWDVSHVKNMDCMFLGSHFQGDISKWNVSSVKDMNSTFRGSPFTGDLSAWNVGNVEDMSFMFYESLFEGNISKWDVSNVKTMSSMFAYSKFNTDISSWNTSSVTTMRCMFDQSLFEGDISRWPISQYTNLEYFLSVEKMLSFSIPTAYHWLLALQKDERMELRPEWLEHYNSVGSVVQSIASSSTHAAILMQQSWLERNAHYLSKAEPLNFDFSQYPGSGY